MIIRKIAELMVDNYIFEEEISNRLGGEMRVLKPTQLQLKKEKLTHREILNKRRMELEFRIGEITVNRPGKEIRARKFDIRKQVNVVTKFQESEWRRQLSTF